MSAPRPAVMNANDLSRRRQRKKSDEMRQRLLDATLDVIADEGWAAATSARISEVAGVSRGAQTHHYPTKASLLLAALDLLTERFESEVRARFTALPAEDRTLRQLLDLLWTAYLDDRHNFSVLEALIAARTDPELGTGVAELDDRAVATLRSLATEVTDAAAPESDIADAIESAIVFYRGLIVQRGLHANPDHLEQLARSWRESASRSLTG
ncbi:MAG: TetR family transcriptional regulator [Actinomycetota bacterium]